MKTTTVIPAELQAILDTHHVDKANIKRIYVKGGTETYYAYKDADGNAKLGKYVTRYPKAIAEAPAAPVVAEAPAAVEAVEAPAVVAEDTATVSA